MRENNWLKECQKQYITDSLKKINNAVNINKNYITQVQFLLNYQWNDILLPLLIKSIGKK